MQEELDKSQLGLQRAHAREEEGMIFINLARKPMDFDAADAAIAPVAHPQGLNRAKVEDDGLRCSRQLEAGLGKQP